MNIEQLSDFPSLQQLSQSLWRRQGEQRGAAVLVGAGFSLNAELAASDTPRPPLWPNLHRKMADTLYPGEPTRAPLDALRLAEEYRAFFGQSALDDFIRANVCDESWYPSKTHSRLLELPWADVLTTNWDTLLERAAKKIVTQTYEIVRTSGDLARARGPRIVKLHGTIGVTERFVFAEEDYRLYPQRNAAFVNFARQVFIENELCLLGFSGDDPNFLQWSGWVRDHLASSSRRIYLVGVLRLSAAKRKLLESRNVAPIDLEQLVATHPQSDQHSAATDALLSYLKTSRPTPRHAWTPKEEPSRSIRLTATNEVVPAIAADAAAQLVDQLSRLRAERQSYPGWLVCPQPARRILRRNCLEASDLVRIADDKLTGQEREEVLYELAWRFDMAMMPLTQDIKTALTALVSEIESTKVDREQRRLLLRVLIYTAREEDDVVSFERLCAALKLLAVTDSEAAVELAYQRCLWMKEQMDFVALEENISLVQGQDPVWKLRRAFLLCELRRWPDAEKLILGALEELRNRESDARNSLWIRSRRSWAQWLGLASVSRQFHNATANDEELSRDFSLESASKCDPWSEIEGIATEVREAYRTRQSEDAERFIPLFEPGSYRHDANTIRVKSFAVAAPDYVMRRFVETVGLPFQIDIVHLIPFEADAIGLHPSPTVRWYLGLTRYANDEKHQLVARFLGRIAIATLPADVARELVGIVMRAIQYWKKRAHDAIAPADRISAVEALVRQISMLYRLTPRMDTDTAVLCFRLGIDLGSDPILVHHWLIDPLSNLFKHAARAMPVVARSQAALAAFEFPLVAEFDMNFPMAPRWPNPLDDLLFEPFRLSNHDPKWSERVKGLLKLATLGSACREQAIRRLTTVALSNALRPEELIQLGEVLWAQTDGRLPTGTHLLTYTFGVLPAPDGIDRADRVRNRLFDDTNDVVRNLDRLDDIWHAAIYKAQPLLPNSAQAKLFFDGIVEHYTKNVTENPDLPLFGTRLDDLRRAAGYALAMSIVPALDIIQRNENRARFLLELTRTSSVWTAISGLPYFMSCGEDVSLLIIERISEGITGLTSDEVSSSAMAIEAWHRLCDKQDGGKAIPSRLLEAAVGAFEARRDTGLQSVVWCCRKLLPTFLDEPSFLRRIARAVIASAAESDYAKVDPMEPRAVSLSMVRAECCLLARDILKHIDEPALEAWLDRAKADPLPEVRFAAMSSDETTSPES